MTAYPTTLRADVFPDILPGWCGPVQTQETCDSPEGFYWRDRVTVGVQRESGMIRVADRFDLTWFHPHFVRLDLTRPECRAQLRLVLERGATGRAPVPTSHLMPRCEGGSLPDDIAHHAPALLVAHTLSVAAGGRGIAGVLGSWFDWCGIEEVTSRVAVAGSGRADVFAFGWSAPGKAEGREHGVAGKVAADAEALAAGHAILDADGTLHLPTDAREGEE